MIKERVQTGRTRHTNNSSSNISLPPIQPLFHQQQPVVKQTCPTHNAPSMYIGYDPLCKSSCHACQDCTQDPTDHSHRRQNKVHPMLNLQNVVSVFRALSRKNSERYERNRQQIDEYFQKVVDSFVEQINTAKAKQYKLAEAIMLTQITQNRDKLDIIQRLYFENGRHLTCSEISSVAPEFIKFKLTDRVSHGYQQLTDFLKNKGTNLAKEMELFVASPKYGDITGASSKVDVDYPLFHRPPRPPTPPPPPPSPPKKVRKESPKKEPPPPPEPPKPYEKPFSIIDVKDNRSHGVKKIEFEESKTLTKEEGIQVISYMPRAPKFIELLYRASQHKFSIPKFHQMCDGISGTVTIVRTEFGKVIGGYTPIPWKSTNGTMHTDSSLESFLFSVTLKQKMELKDPKTAIFNYVQYGPCFGAGNDLAILPKANTERSSYAQFPHSYNNSYNHQANQQTTTFFTGQSRGKSFRIQDWEVWRIRF